MSKLKKTKKYLDHVRFTPVQTIRFLGGMDISLISKNVIVVSDFQKEIVIAEKIKINIPGDLWIRCHRDHKFDDFIEILEQNNFAVLA